MRIRAIDLWLAHRERANAQEQLEAEQEARLSSVRAAMAGSEVGADSAIRSAGLSADAQDVRG